MKIILIRFFNPKKYLFSLLTVGCCIVLLSKPAYSQIDYSYGLNKKGLRLSLGLGGNSLQTTWSPTVGYTLLSGISYDINNYFNVGLEGQYGSLSGSDQKGTYKYSKTVTLYQSATANLRFALGLFSDFESQNGFTDAIKRAYIGLGYGVVLSKSTLTKGNAGSTSGQEVPLYDVGNGTVKSLQTQTTPIIPINIGTNIALLGLWGTDKIELNPNVQVNLFSKALADGYQPQPTSAAGGYWVTSLNLRYKF
jgi:hypothetical protein